MVELFSEYQINSKQQLEEVERFSQNNNGFIAGGLYQSNPQINKSRMTVLGYYNLKDRQLMKQSSQAVIKSVYEDFALDDKINSNLMSLNPNTMRDL